MCLSIFKKSVKNSNSIQPCGTIEYSLTDAIVRAKFEELGGNYDIDVFLPDQNNKIYRKADVLASHELTEVAAIPYVSETHDCDDFAAELYGKFAGLIWTDAHAFNWFIDENNELWFVEPQNKSLSGIIEGQIGNIKFFLGR